MKEEKRHITKHLKMKNIIQILALLLLFSSCEIDVKQEMKDEKEEKKQININSIAEKLSQNCTVEHKSKNLEKIIDFLKKDGYSFESKIINQDFQIGFKGWGTSEDIKKITYQNCTYLEVKFIKNTPINGSYYPKFKLNEICFDSRETAKEYHHKFNQIIKQQEKNYGYVLLNGKRLIYCQTGVNMYGFVINDLKGNFEKILKAGS